MGQKTKLKPKNHYQIHKGRVSEPKSSSNSKFIEDTGHIEKRKLDEYSGLVVEDVDDEYEYEAYDSAYRLVQTENEEFLIVHSRTVSTGPWSFMEESEEV